MYIFCGDGASYIFFVSLTQAVICEIYFLVNYHFQKYLFSNFTEVYVIDDLPLILFIKATLFPQNLNLAACLSCQ